MIADVSLLGSKCHSSLELSNWWFISCG